MAAQNPRPEEPRDAAHWARHVGRLEVSDVPEGGVNLNVDGRGVVGPLQGFGKMWQKTYRVRLEGAATTPDGVVEAWKENFGAFWPSANRFYAPPAGIVPGEVALLGSGAPGSRWFSTGVMVLYADEESFTYMTPEEHLFSGWITFGAYEEEGGTTVAQVQSLARANDPIYELGFRVAGSTEQERIWTHVLKSLAAHFGVNEPVTLVKVCVDPKLQWSQIKNVWHNAGARSMLYTITGPGRWMRDLMRRRGT